MIVTPAQAGVQFKDAWIPACAGMTDGYHPSVLNNIFGDISGAQHQNPSQKCLLGQYRGKIPACAFATSTGY
jgi:hypothetical protein